MVNKLHRLLPITALCGAALVIISLVLGVSQRNSFLKESGETRQAVETAMAGLTDSHPERADDPSLDLAVKELSNAPFVATVWLFDAKGRILYSAGSTAASTRGGTAEELGMTDMARIIYTLPKGTLSDEQYMLLMAASAIQREGEHNDVYRHLLRPLHRADGSLVAMIGVAYNVSPAVSQPGLWPLLSLGMLFLGLTLYWFSLPLWTYLDASERREKALTWACFVLIGNLAALLAYLLVRRPPGTNPV